MTTARKAVTLLLSYMIFTKPLTEQHGSGLILIGMGIILKLLPQNKPNDQRVLNSSTAMSKISKSDERRILQLEIVEEDEEKRPLV